jgi:hypothetical protein
MYSTHEPLRAISYSNCNTRPSGSGEEVFYGNIFQLNLGKTIAYNYNHFLKVRN